MFSFSRDNLSIICDLVDKNYDSCILADLLQESGYCNDDMLKFLRKEESFTCFDSYLIENEAELIIDENNKIARYKNKLFLNMKVNSENYPFYSKYNSEYDINTAHVEICSNGFRLTFCSKESKFYLFSKNLIDVFDFIDYLIFSKTEKLGEYNYYIDYCFCWALFVKFSNLDLPEHSDKARTYNIKKNFCEFIKDFYKC